MRLPHAVEALSVPVTISYVEHLHVFPVHVQQLDFRDNGVPLSTVRRIRRFGWRRQPPGMEGNKECIE